MNNSSNGMVRYRDYVAGWLDSSIHDFLQHFPLNSKSMEFALITSLDSNLTPSSLLSESPELRSVVHQARPLASGILLPTSLMLEAQGNHRIFFGFDEVWFFPDDKIVPKPDSAWLVGPRRIDQKKLDALGSWMDDNGCSLALGDGDGLNFLVKARGLVKYMIACSMLQARATTTAEAQDPESALLADAGLED